jgi:hypothetical protein
MTKARRNGAFASIHKKTPHARGMLFHSLGTNRMPPAKCNFSEEQSPNALGFCFVPSIVADQALVMTLCGAESVGNPTQLRS